MFTSTVTALLKLSDTRTFERYPLVSALRLCAWSGGKTWNVTQGLDNKYLQELFGLEYLLRQIREEICRPAILQMTKYLDEDFFRLKRNKQESMSAWALRDDKSTRTFGANG